MKKTVIYLMLLTIIGKILAFGKDLVLTYYYGASNVTDAYIIALTIPTVIFAFIGDGLQRSFMPVYSSVVNDNGEEEGNNFTNNILSLLLIVSIIITFVIFLRPEYFVKVFASGFDSHTAKLATQLTRISSFSVFFIGLTYIFQGYLQINKRFAIPALTSVPYNIVLIVSIILSIHAGIHVLALGVTFAYISQVIFMLPAIKRNSYKFKLRLDPSDKRVREMVYLILPLIVGSSVTQMNQLVDRTLASQYAVGGISALNYATRLNGIVQGIFVSSIVTVLYANVSKMAAKGDIEGVLRQSKNSIIGIVVLVMPATVVSMFLAEPIVKVLFGRGAFDSNAIKMTSSALFFYSIGMAAFGIRQILNRVFYSIKDTKTPTYNGILAMVLNIILNLILAYFMGISGLALATSLSTILCVILLAISLHKKIGLVGMKKVITSFFKILFASVGMGLVVKLSFNYLEIYVSQIFSIFVSVIIGGIAYLLIICFIKIEEVDNTLGTIKKRLYKIY